MDLTLEDIEKITRYVDGFVTINGTEYYIKGSVDEGLQIVANEIASYLSINCVKDYFIKTSDDAYYLSLSLNNFGTFKNGQDRNLGNIGILESDGKAYLYILDNEFVFSTYEADLRAKIGYEERLKKSYYKDILNNHTPLNVERNLEGLEYFMGTSSSEYSDLVVDFYQKLTPEYVLSVFSKYEQDGIVLDKVERDYYLVLYKMNYNLIGKLLVERGLIDGQRISKN